MMGYLLAYLYITGVPLVILGAVMLIERSKNDE